MVHNIQRKEANAQQNEGKTKHNPSYNEVHFFKYL